MFRAVNLLFQRRSNSGGNGFSGSAGIRGLHRYLRRQNVWQLGCLRENGTFYPLVNNVTNLTVLYGVNTSGSGTNVDTYMTAAQVTAATAWNNVISAMVTLTFTNPLYVAANPQGQLATLTVQRYIAIMRQT